LRNRQTDNSGEKEKKDRVRDREREREIGRKKGRE
jgi:hypothetical protein